MKHLLKIFKIKFIVGAIFCFNILGSSVVYSQNPNMQMTVTINPDGQSSFSAGRSQGYYIPRISEDQIRYQFLVAYQDALNKAVETIKNRNTEIVAQGWESVNSLKQKFATMIDQGNLEVRKEEVYERAFKRRQKKNIIETSEKIESEVSRISKDIQENIALPSLTAKFEEEASRYIREQLVASEIISHQAVELAQAGASSVIVNLLSDFAIDTVSAAHALVSGFSNGFYDGFVTTSQAMEAIYKNPTLVSNLAKNILHYVQEGGLARSQNQAMHYVGSWKFVEDIKDSFAWYYVHVKTSSVTQLATETGHAAGYLTSNIVQAM
jgi:hypothetical protein